MTDQSASDPPPNALERALARARGDDRHRAEFYRVLLESDVFVFGHTEDTGNDAQALPREKRVTIGAGMGSDGTQRILFFSSEAAMNRAFEEPPPYLRMPVPVLFEMMRGNRLVLNPAVGDRGREFLPEEVERLLRGENPAAPGTDPVTLRRETQLHLGQPAEYPHDLVRALSRRFATLPQVRAAYLGEYRYADAPGDPHLMVGIDAGDAFRAVIDRLDPHAAGPVITYLAMNDADPVTGYLARTKPFYARGLGTRLRSIFGG